MLTPEQWMAQKNPSKLSPEEWMKQKGKDKAPAGVYVKPLPGLSQKTTADIYSGLESMTGTIRGGLQYLQEKFPGLEEYMPESFKKSTIEEERKGALALEKSKEYGKGAKIGEVVGGLADPVTYMLPLAKASSVAQFVKQAAIVGGGAGFLRAKTEEESRVKGAETGLVSGVVGGAILGTVLHVGGKLFGKDWLPWTATPEEKKSVEEEISKTIPENEKETVLKDVNHFLNAPEDTHINAKNKAIDLIESGASKKKVEAARKKDKLVGHYIDEYQQRYDNLKEGSLGITKQGEVLPPETPLPTEEIGKGVTIEGEVTGKTSAAGQLHGGIPGEALADFIKSYPQLASAGLGAGVGAAYNKDDPLEGAILGAAAGYGGMSAIKTLGAGSIAEGLFKKLLGETPPQTIKDAQKLVSTSLDELRARARDVYSTTNKVNDLVPNVADREKITNAIEHPELAKGLSADEKTAYDSIKKSFSDIGKRAEEAGVIKGMLENYITHIVDWNKAPTKLQEALSYFLGEGVSGRFPGKTASKYGKERTYKTIEDLNKALEGSGLRLKTKDPSEILSIYANSMEKAIVGKTLIKNLESMKTPDGQSLIMNTKGKFIPYGWKTNPSIYLQGKAVHPELAPILEHMFSTNNPGALLKALVAITNLSKRWNVMYSFFHAASLGQAMLASGKVPFAGAKAAFEQFRKGGLGDSVDHWIKAGLITETPIDVDKAAFGNFGALADAVSQKFGGPVGLEKVLGGAEKATMKFFDKVTWDYGQTGQKLVLSEHLLDKARINHPDVPEAVLRKHIVDYVNNSFGGLNWGQIASESNNKAVQALTSPGGRQGLNILMFAPDWTISTLRALTSAFGKNTGWKGLVKPLTTADYARQYQLRTLFLYFTLANGLNMVTSGKPIWENKDKTRIEFKDGTTMQLSKHAMEPVHWLLHPEQTLANKMGLLFHAANVYWGEKEYPFGPDLEDTSPLGKMKKIGSLMLPFSAQSGIQSAADTQEALKRIAAGMLGLPIYGQTMKEKAEARRRRLLKRYEKMREAAQRR